MKSVTLRAMAIGMALALAAGVAGAADWPCYRGANHDQISTETGLLTSWPAGGPKVLWKIPVGEAFGAIAIKGDRAYFLAEQDKQEACFCIDTAAGKQVWAVPLDKSIQDKQGGNGPRSAPAVDGDLVYVLGTYLKVTCLNAVDGKVVWAHDLVKEYAGQIKTPGISPWGSAASPIVEGKNVIVVGGGAGQAVMAFDKATGNLAWKALDEKITHATPTPATILGTRQIVCFMQSGLVSISPEDGKELWRYKFPFSVLTAASPVVGGDMVYCSAGYNVGGAAVKISKGDSGWQVKELWRTPKENVNHWSTPVIRDGYVYGIYGFKEHGTAPLKCIELATGKEKWSQKGFGPGQVILVDGHLLATTDKGGVVLVKATPEQYTEVGRAQPLGGKCWTVPSFSNGRFFMRTVSEMACLELGSK